MKKFLFAIAAFLAATVGAYAQPAPSIFPGCVYNSTPPTLSDKQTTAIQCDSSGRVKVSGAGTVTSLTAGTGITLTPSPITTAGSIALTVPVTVALGGTNATSASITAFNNITGYTASGATGTTSTNLVFSTSPVLVTPALGVATATSLAIGGATIGSNALAVTGTANISAALTLGTSGILVGGTNVIDQRNGTTAQTFNLYESYTDASNYNRFAFTTGATNYSIGPAFAGTGAARTLRLQSLNGSSAGPIIDLSASAQTIQFTRAGTAIFWEITAGGHFTAPTDNTYDIGASGATRPRRIYVGTGVTVPGGAAFLTTSTALTDGAAAQVATMTNGPTAGNPTKWIGINDNGTTRYIPAW